MNTRRILRLAAAIPVVLASSNALATAFCSGGPAQCGPNYVLYDTNAFPQSPSTIHAFTYNYNFEITSSVSQQVGVTLDYILQAGAFATPQVVPPFDNVQAHAEVDVTDQSSNQLFTKSVDVGNNGAQALNTSIQGTVANPATASLLLQTNTVYTIFMVGSGGVDATFSGAKPGERSVGYAQAALAFDPLACPGCTLVEDAGVTNSIDGQGLPNLPIPAAAWLLLSGLGFIGGIMRRRG